MPENKERIQNYLLNTTEDSKTAKIIKLLTLNHGNMNIRLAQNLLSESILQEIENSLHGKWKVKELDIHYLIEEIQGRRLKYKQMTEIFQNWIGDDEQCILFVKSDNEGELDLICEGFKKYGVCGEILSKEIRSAYGNSTYNNKQYKDEDSINELLKEQELLELINWQSYSKDKLIELIDIETLPVIKKRIRQELYYRHVGKTIEDETLSSIKDELIKETLYIMRVLNSADKYTGIELLKNVIGPLNIMVEELDYLCQTQEEIDAHIVKTIKTKYAKKKAELDDELKRIDNIKDTEYIKQTLEGTVIVLDGMRYDIWCMIKKEIRAKGFSVNDDIFRINTPSTTENFRKSLNIEDNGTLNGKTLYIKKWAEHKLSKKTIKTILNKTEEIKMLHFNFIDSRAHGSTFDLYPLYKMIREDFIMLIMPLLDILPNFTIISDHGFSDTKKVKERYTHGSDSLWETILPIAKIGL
ncbi:hypothetical protein MCHI_004108 [Candidatus Magnetoovum chiemensis]|nr:hypothetical protein MCHI_004108 [Candidatus Magnetoovum chiemensis]